MLEKSPLRIAVVGLNFGRYILEELCQEPARSFFEIAAVCDVDVKRAADFAAKFNVPAYTTLESLLADRSIPVVGLFTGPAGRAELLRQIIKSGKDVMTTKPFEVDSKAARQVLEEARSLRRIIHLNSPGPSSLGYVKQIHLWQQKNDLGLPVSCRGEIAASYREIADGSWMDDPGKCPVAPIFRLGIYLINDLVRLFGGVREVQVQSSRLFTGRPTPDNAQLGLLFQNGVLGSIFATFCVENGQQYGNSLILHYERGSIFRNMEPVEFGRAGGVSRLRLVTTDGKQNVVTDEWQQEEKTGGYQWECLYQAILRRDEQSMPVEEIVHGIEIIEAMSRAEKTRRTEAVSTEFGRHPK